MDDEKSYPQDADETFWECGIEDVGVALLEVGYRGSDNDMLGQKGNAPLCNHQHPGFIWHVPVDLTHWR